MPPGKRTLCVEHERTMLGLGLLFIGRHGFSFTGDARKRLTAQSLSDGGRSLTTDPGRLRTLRSSISDLRLSEPILSVNFTLFAAIHVFQTKDTGPSVHLKCFIVSS
jgi:hypothetical protein